MLNSYRIQNTAVTGNGSDSSYPDMLRLPPTCLARVLNTIVRHSM